MSFTALPAGERLKGYEIQGLLSTEGSFSLVYMAADTDPARIERRRAKLSARVAEWRAAAGGAAILAAEPAPGPQVVIKEFFPRELARRTSDGRSVAAKPAKGRIYEWSRSRFLDESRILLTHSHPNVISVFDIVSSNNTEYMVMEALSGGSLMDVAQASGGQDEAAVRRWLHPVLRALQSLEAKGVDHLDLSPSNIVFRSTGGDPVLIDFGAARTGAPARTRSSRLIVNDGYSPPEKYRSTSHQLDSRTDVYGLGAVINFALTGERPLSAVERSGDAAKAGGLSDKAVALRQRRASAGFLAAVDGCFSLDPARRPADAFQAEPLLGPWASVAPAAPAIDVDEASPARRRGMIAFLALLLLLLLLLLLFPVLGGADAR